MPRLVRMAPLCGHDQPLLGVLDVATEVRSRLTEGVGGAQGRSEALSTAVCSHVIEKDLLIYNPSRHMSGVLGFWGSVS